MINIFKRLLDFIKPKKTKFAFLIVANIDHINTRIPVCFWIIDEYSSISQIPDKVFKDASIIIEVDTCIVRKNVNGSASISLPNDSPVMKEIRKHMIGVFS